MTESLLTIAQARARILHVSGGRLGAEPAQLDDALDRVLAADVRAAADAPSFRSSAMDGYALGAAGPPRSYRIVGESRAGRPYAGSVTADEAIRISTGAHVPDTTVAVVRQEDTALGTDSVETTTAVADGANIRGAGEEMGAGELVVADGTRLGAAALAAVVTAGAGDTLPVARRPVVAVICTGDELRAPGAPLEPGAIHNSNGPMLRALARRAGATVRPIVHAADDADATVAALGAALDEADLVLVSGGASIGPHDHTRAALASLDVDEHFWGVAMRPGKPAWFGSRGRTLVFALPGHPVAAAITFALFARPALAALQGTEPEPPPAPTATLATAIDRHPERGLVLAVTLDNDGGPLRATPFARRASRLITTLARADALALIPAGTGRLEPGDPVSLEAVPR